MGPTPADAAAAASTTSAPTQLPAGATAAIMRPTRPKIADDGTTLLFPVRVTLKDGTTYTAWMSLAQAASVGIQITAADIAVGDTGAPSDTSTVPPPPPPPNIDLTKLLNQLGAPTKPVDPEITAGEQLYFQIWGVQPPKDYIKGLVGQGLNVFEITQHELSKPGATRTQFYRDQLAQYGSIAAQIMGKR
jgi:hypothetical protein